MTAAQRTYIICLFLLVPAVVFPQRYKFTSFNTEDGLPQPYIYTLSQDSLGNLWIGTGDGLSRYDGFSFDLFNRDDSLPSDFITCSLSNGKEMWFGHGNGAVSVFDGEIFREIGFSERISDRITCFSSDSENAIWVSTFTSGLFRLNRTSMLFEKIVPVDALVNTICNISPYEIIVGTNSGLNICLLDNNGNFSSVNNVPEIPLSKITSAIKLEDINRFIISTENEGLFEIEQGNSDYKISKIDDSPVLTGIQSICEDADSNIWIATFGNGLVKMTRRNDGFNFESFTTSNGFTTDNVKTVFEDREGNIWSGNFGEGLTRINPVTFTFFEPGSSSGSSVFSVLADGDYLWAGTGKGLLKTDRATGKTIGFYSSGSGLPADTVTAIYKDGNNLWIGTGRNGLFKMDCERGKITKMLSDIGQLENSITAITGYNGKIYAGSKKGLSVFDENTIIDHYSINQGLPHNWINSLYSDDTGSIWITTRSKVLAYLKDRKITKFPVIIGAGTGAPGPVTSDAARIWVGSSGNGIFIIEADSVMNITAEDGLLTDYCYSLVFDEKFVWASHKDGLSRINPENYTIKSVPGFDKYENIVFNTNAATVSAEGKIIFGSDKGLVTYDPSAELGTNEPPLLSLLSLQVNDAPVKPVNGNIILPPGIYKIRLDYLGSSLKDPELVSYQFRMEGFDDGWSEITRERSVVYNNLAFGRYSFILRASNGDGIITEKPLIINILIRKPVWKYWWFFPALLFICGVLVFYYIRMRERNLKAEKRILEEKVSERTYELELRKNEIEQQRDEIDEKNQNITSSIRYARQIQYALLPPDEILGKALPESFIMHWPKDIVSGDFYWLAERDSKIIFTVADCTGHGVPGAFMSLLGITLLNEIVNVQGITESNEIINMLRKRVIQCMQQQRKGATTLDGMDISLCVLDKKTKKIEFTGAMNDMVLVRDGKLQVITADHLDVSISYNDLGHFTRKDVECREGDMIYLFSDGYQDQFGGEFDKKFLRPHFYTTLVEVHKHPVVDQQLLLEKKLALWMKNRPQTDDITILGIRIL